MAKLSVTLALTILLLHLTSEASRAIAADGNATSSNEARFINCGEGGILEDEEGRFWSGDKNSTLLYSSRVEAASPSSLSSVSAVPYKTARVFQSTFTYPIQVPGERYFLRLYFNPTSYGNFSASNAVFDVACSGYTLLKNFSTSYYAEALNLESIKREYSINASSSTPGWMNVTFTPSSNVSGSFAFVNGIEVVPMFDLYTGFEVPSLLGVSKPYPVDPTLAFETMYRLNVGGSTLPLAGDSGSLYRLWFDDSNYVSGGAFGISYGKDKNVTISYPPSVPAFVAPPDVYGTARSMPWFNDTVNLNFNMSWILTVDPGFFYLVRLHFCEIQSTFTKVNQKVFTIYLDDQIAVQDYDVITRTNGLGVPVYLDSVVFFPKGERPVDLWISLHPYNQFSPQYLNVILNGLEVFKMGVGDSKDLSGPRPPMPPPGGADPTNGLPGGSSGGSRAGLIGGVVGGVVGFLLLTGLVLCCCCRRRKAGDGTHNGWLPISMGGSGRTTTTVMSGSSVPANLCRHFTFAEIKTATNNFNEKLLLGVGGFGKVYSGSIDDGATMVAIKRANPMSQQGLHEFQNEIEMLSQLRHRHLVSLIGCCEENGEMILVYDYMAKGTLREHLYKSKNPPLSWKQRLEICIGAARGLHYLHTGAKYTIIHRDVKTTNILLDDNLVAKVADFGLSKTGPSLDNTHVSTVVKGSFGYLDPEYFRRQQLTEKSDVYSFGVVLFEVLCARPPLMRDLPKEQVSLAEWAVYCQKKGVLSDIMDPLLLGKIAPQCLKLFAETAEKCLADVGLDRPSMGDILRSLELALRIQETAEEGKGAVASWNGESDGNGKYLYDQSSDLKMSTTATSVGIDDRSMASVDSDGLTPTAVFSEIMDPKGR